MRIFNLNKNREDREELAFPDFNIEEFEKVGKDQEAENEISIAIEAIKTMEKKPKVFFQNYKTDILNEIDFKPEAYGIDTIYNLLISARKFLGDLNVEEARKDYTHIMKIYHKLSSEDKSMVYEDVIDLYNERKNAEQLSIK